MQRYSCPSSSILDCYRGGGIWTTTTMYYVQTYKEGKQFKESWKQKKRRGGETESDTPESMQYIFAEVHWWCTCWHCDGDTFFYRSTVHRIERSQWAVIWNVPESINTSMCAGRSEGRVRVMSTLNLLDMGVAHGPVTEGKRGGRGSTPKNTHLLSFPFSRPLSLSPPPLYSFSLSLYQSLHQFPPSPRPCPARSCHLSHTHPHKMVHPC